MRFRYSTHILNIAAQDFLKGMQLQNDDDFQADNAIDYDDSKSETKTMQFHAHNTCIS